MDYPTKICEYCNQKFTYRKTVALNRWMVQKYCSTKCAGTAKRKHFNPRVCYHCNKTFSNDGSVSSKNWEKRKYCSPECGYKATDQAHLRKYQFKKGVHAHGRIKAEDVIGEKNHNWKGENASYAAIHIWMKNHYGKPQECNHCGTTEKRMYHWANVSGMYTRERSDWLRLCVPCHKKHDLSKKGTRE